MLRLIEYGPATSGAAAASGASGASVPQQARPPGLQQVRPLPGCFGGGHGVFCHGYALHITLASSSA
jgi:hypothetical protein